MNQVKRVSCCTNRGCVVCAGTNSRTVLIVTGPRKEKTAPTKAKTGQCQECQEPFVARCSHQKFCSQGCWRTAKIQRYTEQRRQGGAPYYERVCAHCKKQFTTQRPQQRTCSSDCRLRLSRASARARYWKRIDATRAAEAR